MAPGRLSVCIPVHCQGSVLFHKDHLVYCSYPLIFHVHPLFHALTLEGAMDGLAHYVHVDWSYGVP